MAEGVEVVPLWRGPVESGGEILPGVVAQVAQVVGGTWTIAIKTKDASWGGGGGGSKLQSVTYHMHTNRLYVTLTEHF